MNSPEMKPPEMVNPLEFVQPVIEVTPEELEEWRELNATLKKNKDREMELRRKIVQKYFGNRGEGTHKVDFGDFTLKASIKFSPEVDTAVLATLREPLAGVGVNIDAYVRWTPALKVTEYKKLDPNQKKIFDEAVTLKPSAPSLEWINEE